MISMFASVPFNYSMTFGNTIAKVSLSYFSFKQSAKSLISLLNKGHDVFSKEENDKFFEGIQKFDNWEDIANHVGTRSIYSIRRKAKGLINEKNKFPTPSFDKTKLEKLY